MMRLYPVRVFRRDRVTITCRGARIRLERGVQRISPRYLTNVAADKHFG
jgi:hypothetical protein